ncbi:hypothetical protein SAMN04488564_107189 [Lentzea waywayandensis]|uniref:DUF308 domain-containing protein n=1 Tax=Lentzea waywayandensis TaxID=84724 RepID=A0A1I6F1S8_9PSEU|nr:hypothetical protein [Lentzea waywayandensis]SFR23863.1 hypothetical protein SAMN04488564_107189 [Lentzea waywayandensis]
MNARRDSTDGPENVDELFAEIVAGLERDGVGKDWLDLDEAGPQEPRTIVADEPAPEPADEPEGRDPADEDHYVPPEPPPFPVLRASTLAALGLFVLGILLLVAPGIFGLQARIGTPLSLVALCAGVGWLILRMRNTPPPDSGWDDGAQV